MGNEKIGFGRFARSAWLTFPLLFLSFGWGGEIKRVDPEDLPFLLVHENTCNSYLIRSEKACLVIDWGTGEFLPQLESLGIKGVDRVLFTHHHREQLQGAGLINRSTTDVWAPEKERDFFEQPASFRKWWPKLGDKFSVYGASYLVLPLTPLLLTARSVTGSPLTGKASASAVSQPPDILRATWPTCSSETEKPLPSRADTSTTEPSLALGSTVSGTTDSAKGSTPFSNRPKSSIPTSRPSRSLPRSPIVRATRQLETFKEKLTRFRTSYLRGYPVHKMKPEEADGYSQPTNFPLMNRVTPHLYKLNPKTLGKNFSIIISDNGRGLILDSGLFPELLLHRLIQGMKEHFGLKGIDALWISHMHGDHFLHARILKEKYGAKTWTLDRITDKCENPRRYDYAALVSAYGDGFDGVPIDKPFKNGESVEWEGYKIQVDWMPGQTEFGCCLWLEIDGKKIAFTGDNLFADSSNPEQNGHEAVVARNSSIFEEGYVGSRYLKELAPDIMMGAHSYAMPEPTGLLHRYHEWSKEIIRLYQDLLPEVRLRVPLRSLLGIGLSLPGRLCSKRNPVRRDHGSQLPLNHTIP